MFEFTRRLGSGQALLAAILETQQCGGGTIWIHRKDCPASIPDEDCPCNPVSVDIEEDIPN